MQIRDARVDEVATLTRIARAAKAYWGYPEEWLELWSDDLRYTEATLCEHDVLVADDGAILGVASLSVDAEVAEIEGLWVTPGAMGRGIGRRLLREVVRRARAVNAGVLKIVSDPQAEGFYLRMGAVRRGEVPSTPPGRTLPVLELDLRRR